MDQGNRVVVLIDMDCFYCQVEEKLNPELQGKPVAVVQYNPWKGGGIVAVNYEARAMGVTRYMRGDEAKEKCPEIALPSVPCLRGKADISKYREAGIDVAKVLQRFTPLLERASIDEAYLDITAPVEERLKNVSIHTISSALMPNTFALGYDDVDQFILDVQSGSNDSIDFDLDHARKLLMGALIVSEIRAAVFDETGYRCSAGISHNKILAKLVCGMNKPNKQTVLPKHCVNVLYETLPVKKVKHLGGKFGDAVCEILKINNMIELQNFQERELQARFDEKNGTWLYNIARGVDLEPVQAKFNPKSIGCCKQFRGKTALIDLDSLKKWLNDLGEEIEDRLEKDSLESNRTPKQMVVSFSTQLKDGKDCSSSRSYNFGPDDELCSQLFSMKALELVLESAEGCKPKDGEVNRRLKAPIKFLGISVGKFEDNSESKKTKKIVDYFTAGAPKENVAKNIQINTKEEKRKSDNGKEYVMQKFFQVTNKNDINTQDKAKNVLEARLDKQESFFAKFLNKNEENTSKDKENDATAISVVRPTTPDCKVLDCGDDSNDTDYSSSTINNEINKSIALFEDDPEEVTRVSQMRNLLKTSVDENPVDGAKPTETEEAQENNVIHEPDLHVETFDCSECKKTLPLNLFEMHSDYHLALKLRDEERLQFRKERVLQRITNVNVAESNLSKKKATEDHNQSVSVSSIASFFVKVDENIPSRLCPDCGKKVQLEKYSEHLDFHEAQKLSRELNRKSVPTPTSFTSSSAKRKKSISPLQKPKIPCKSIDSFFR